MVAGELAVILAVRHFLVEGGAGVEVKLADLHLGPGSKRQKQGRTRDKAG